MREPGASGRDRVLLRRGSGLLPVLAAKINGSRSGGKGQALRASLAAELNDRVVMLPLAGHSDSACRALKVLLVQTESTRETTCLKQQLALKGEEALLLRGLGTCTIPACSYGRHMHSISLSRSSSLSLSLSLSLFLSLSLSLCLSLES